MTITAKIERDGMVTRGVRLPSHQLTLKLFIMKNLTELTKAYELEFTNCIIAYAKKGFFYGHPKFTREYYYELIEVLRELSVDYEEIEERYFPKG